MKVKVVRVDSESIQFDNGVILYGHHDRDCCEEHYLSFKDLTIDDFEGLLFDIDGDDFFKRIEGYGIELIPINGHSVKVPGYGSNNGYYSENLTLALVYGTEVIKSYDITDCQEVTG